MLDNIMIITQTLEIMKTVNIVTKWKSKKYYYIAIIMKNEK